MVIFYILCLVTFVGRVFTKNKTTPIICWSWKYLTSDAKKTQHRPNVPENTSLSTAISVCCQLIGGEMLTVIWFPPSSHKAGILWTSHQMLRQSVFPEEWEQCLDNSSALGGFIEVVPTIIVKQSGLVCFVFSLFIILWFCFAWISTRLEWWSSVKEMHHPFLCSLLPLEIIPVYFGNGSQTVLLLLLPQFIWFAAKLHADFLKMKNAERNTTFQSVISPVIFIFFLSVSSSNSPPPFVWRDAHTRAWVHSRCVPDIGPWAL